MKYQSIIYSIVILLFFCSSCGPSEGSNSNKKFSHNHDVIYYTTKGEDQILKQKLSKDIDIVNHLFQELGLKHHFNFKDLRPFGNRTLKTAKEYFFDERYADPEVIRIFIDPNTSLDNESRYLHERRFISISNHYIHDIAQLSHELVHAVLKDLKNDIHVPSEYKAVCTTNSNYFCLNLMSRSVFTPFNFLLTKGQQDIINTGTFDITQPKLSPCDLYYPDNVKAIADKIECYPQIERWSQKDHIAFENINGVNLTKMSAEEKKQFNWIMIKLINKSTKLGLKPTTQFVQDPNDNPVLYDSTGFENTVNLAVAAMNFHYTKSEFYSELLNQEAEFLSNKGAIIEKNTLIDRKHATMEMLLKGEAIRIKSMVMDNLDELAKIFPMSQQLFLVEGSEKPRKGNLFSYEFQQQNRKRIQLYANTAMRKNIEKIQKGNVIVTYSPDGVITSIKRLSEANDRMVIRTRGKRQN